MLADAFLQVDAVINFAAFEPEKSDPWEAAKVLSCAPQDNGNGPDLYEVSEVPECSPVKETPVPKCKDWMRYKNHVNKILHHSCFVTMISAFRGNALSQFFSIFRAQLKSLWLEICQFGW